MTVDRARSDGHHNECSNVINGWQVLDLDVALHGPSVASDDRYRTGEVGFFVARWADLLTEVEMLLGEQVTE